jgi:ABC-type uncharacterized transport system permease subunit
VLAAHVQVYPTDFGQQTIIWYTQSTIISTVERQIHEMVRKPHKSIYASTSASICVFSVPVADL